MNILEYEAKDILHSHGIPIPKSETIQRGEIKGIQLPAVLKSQVPVGSRGKLGGIRITNTQADALSSIQELFTRPIKNHLPNTLLAEEVLDIDKEFYFSILIDRSTSSIRIIAHPQGGIEVEENNADDFFNTTVTSSNSSTVGEQLVELYNAPDQTFALQDMVENIYKCFVANDATLIEINPLVLTHDKRIIAGDCKMVLDDAAAFRHPSWSFEQQMVESDFVTLDPNGQVATIANGAGLAMATVDAVADYGLRPANFLDVGGGASSESVLVAFKRIMEYPDVRVIVINIFAGITRCDEIARAIITAKQQLPDLAPLCIRLAGNNYQQAAELLEQEDIPLLPTLEACLDAAKEYIP